MIATRYEIDPEDIFTNISVEWRSTDQWAVRRLGMVYSTATDSFVYEPSPSKRTEDFLTCTRFSFDDAMRIAQRQYDRMVGR